MFFRILYSVWKLAAGAEVWGLHLDLACYCLADSGWFRDTVFVMKSKKGGASCEDRDVEELLFR